MLERRLSQVDPRAGVRALPLHLDFRPYGPHGTRFTVESRTYTARAARRSARGCGKHLAVDPGSSSPSITPASAVIPAWGRCCWRKRRSVYRDWNSPNSSICSASLARTQPCAAPQPCSVSPLPDAWATRLEDSSRRARRSATRASRRRRRSSRQRHTYTWACSADPLRNISKPARSATVTEATLSTAICATRVVTSTDAATSTIARNPTVA